MEQDKKNPYILRRTFNFFTEEVSPLVDIDVEIVESKDSLNNNIWDGFELKKDIRIAILKIAKAFNEYLKLGAPIKDVVFTGSLANYNWTLLSDLDIHLILDLNSLDESEEFVEEYIMAKKSLWNDDHNITIKGFEVEMYAKDEETLTSSKGIFSVLKNKWIQKPEKYTSSIDDIAIKEKAAVIMNEIDNLLSSDNDESTFKKAEKIKDKISKLRDSGLERGGEYSIENLVFKTLRKTGYLEKLSEIKKKAFDNSLTVVERSDLKENISSPKSLLSEGKEGFKKEYGCLMLDLPIKNWEQITNTVKKDDIFDEEGFGIEEVPHVTVLFGFIPEKTNPKDVEKIVKKHLKDRQKIKIKLKEISLFENKDKEVLKFDIESEDLQSLNKLLRKEFEYKSDYPDYHPHMTIAYLNPGTGKKYVKELKKPIEFESGNFSYSYPPNEKHIFSIKIGKNTLGVEKGIVGMTDEKVEIIKNFINFVCNRLELEEPVEIYLHKGRDEYIMTTASYVPNENSNHIRCDNRALVDILRSIAHELTHNRQREIESFVLGEDVPTIGGWIEDEANAKAGILIKDFAMNHGFDEIYDL
jgi:2'-5' RNA ligase/predicted nucleotidyltransferase